MNVSFLDQEKVVEKPSDIIVDDEKVGEIKPQNSGSKYMAVLSINGSEIMSRSYGHGDTKEEAIVDALNYGREGAKTFLRNLNALEAKMFQDKYRGEGN